MADLSQTPRQRWLACPTTDSQVECYWSCLGRLRHQGIELELCLCLDARMPPWEQFHDGGRWHGVVLLGPGLQSERLLVLARQHEVTVWQLARAAFNGCKSVK